MQVFLRDVRQCPGSKSTGTNLETVNEHELLSTHADHHDTTFGRRIVVEGETHRAEVASPPRRDCLPRYSKQVKGSKPDTGRGCSFRWDGQMVLFLF